MLNSWVITVVRVVFSLFVCFFLEYSLIIFIYRMCDLLYIFLNVMPWTIYLMFFNLFSVSDLSNLSSLFCFSYRLMRAPYTIKNWPLVVIIICKFPNLFQFYDHFCFAEIAHFFLDLSYIISSITSVHIRSFLKIRSVECLSFFLLFFFKYFFPIKFFK